MLKIGLTGGIGSGKTAASDIFEQLGVPVIDADVIARNLVNEDPLVLKEIIEAFGQDVLTLDGQLNRKKLAQIIFHIKENKEKLEHILHPRVRTVIHAQIQALASGKNVPPYIIIVIPLLLEADYCDTIDRVLVIFADENTRIQRVKQRDKRTLNEIRSIISNQLNDDSRLKSADETIENNSDINNLQSMVKQLHKKYMTFSAINK